MVVTYEIKNNIRSSRTKGEMQVMCLCMHAMHSWEGEQLLFTSHLTTQTNKHREIYLQVEKLIQVCNTQQASYHSSGMLSSAGRHAVAALARPASIPLSSRTTCAAVFSPCAVRDSSRAASFLVRTTLTLTTPCFFP